MKKRMIGFLILWHLILAILVGWGFLRYNAIFVLPFTGIQTRNMQETFYWTKELILIRRTPSVNYGILIPALISIVEQFRDNNPDAKIQEIKIFRSQTFVTAIWTTNSIRQVIAEYLSGSTPPTIDERLLNGISPEEIISVLKMTEEAPDINVKHILSVKVVGEKIEVKTGGEMVRRFSKQSGKWVLEETTIWSSQPSLSD